jgi:hypothetical protein
MARLPEAIRASIREEIISDPSGRGYAGRPPWDQAALMNEPIAQSPRAFAPVALSPQQVAWILLQRGRWAEILRRAGLPPQPVDDPVWTACASLVEASRLTSIAEADWSAGTLRGYLDTLVTAGVLLAADQRVVLEAARTEVLRSRADAILGRSILSGEIEDAVQ